MAVNRKKPKDSKRRKKSPHGAKRARSKLEGGTGSRGRQLSGDVPERFTGFTSVEAQGRHRSREGRNPDSYRAPERTPVSAGVTGLGRSVQGQCPSDTLSLSAPPDYASVLNAAQEFLDGEEYASAEEAVKPLLTSEVKGDDSRVFLYASRIAAFAAAYRKDFETAEAYSLEALEVDGDLMDIHFLLVRVFTALEEYDLVRAHGTSYLGLLEKKESDDKSVREFSDSLHLAHEVLNSMGVAGRELGHLQEAAELFQRAIRSRQDYDLAYMNLALIAQYSGQTHDALEVLEAGMKACPNSRELAMLRDSISVSRPTVSACMIVKDEEARLPRALDSIKDVCDEIVIVDTGSTDRTVQIAESFGARVYHHEWENDFSKARNQSLQYATKDWILIIDADEELETEDTPLLKRILVETKHNLVSVTVYNLSSGNTLATSFLPSIRLFRRSLGACYDGIVHNQLRFDEKKNTVLRAGIRIKHYGYGLGPEEMRKKVVRSRTLLLKQLEQDPDNAFANFNLAQLYRGESPNPSAEICSRIIAHASKAIEHTDPQKRGERHIHLMALHQMVTAHFFLRELDEAERYCYRALELKDDFIDPIISLGHIYSQKGDWPNARKWFLRYLDEKSKFRHSDETLQIILLNYESEHVAYYGLGIASEAEGKHGEAIECYEKALEHCPDYADTNLRLAQLYFNREDYDKAILEAQRELYKNEYAWPAHFILGECYSRLGKTIPAEKHLLEADRLEPNNADIMSSLARHYFKAGRLNDANRIADRLESEFPDSVPSAKLIGDIRYAAADFQGAVRAYQRLTCGGDIDEDVLNNLGNSHFKLGQFTEAEDCYRRALSVKPDMALAMRNLGISLVRTGKVDEAADKLATFLELNPVDIHVAQLLGDIMLEKGYLSRALAMYELCLSLDPTSYPVITKLADVYLAQGHHESALLGYTQALKLKPDYEPAKLKLEELRALSSGRT